MSAPALSEIATNRKAPRDFQILETYEAGIELRGTEVKSIRLGHVNISDAFARIERGQIWLYGCDIQTYEKASHVTHEPRRSRRLLLHKKEIMKLLVLTQQKGLALPVLKAYWKGPHIKIQIGVGKGRNQSDQRQHLKEKAETREAARVVASFNNRKK
jgi:SsrA-binding protein